MRRKVGVILGVVIVLLVAAGTIARLFLVAIAEPRHMAMAPAVLNGDSVLLWRVGAPALGEVIVYEREPGGGTQAIGRVVAIGPVLLELAAGGMTVKLGEAEIKHTPIPPVGSAPGDETMFGGRASVLETLPGGRAYRVILPERGGKGMARVERTAEVPAGSYFVMNDNRGAPEPDSRTLGTISRERIIGIARWFLSAGPYGAPSHVVGFLDPVL